MIRNALAIVAFLTLIAPSALAQGHDKASSYRPLAQLTVADDRCSTLSLYERNVIDRNKTYVGAMLVNMGSGVTEDTLFTIRQEAAKSAKRTIRAFLSNVICPVA